MGVEIRGQRVLPETGEKVLRRVEMYKEMEPWTEMANSAEACLAPSWCTCLSVTPPLRRDSLWPEPIGCSWQPRHQHLSCSALPHLALAAHLLSAASHFPVLV